MSRALFIDADREAVLATCAKHKAGISTIETLPSGCTRVVFLNGDSAALVRKAYGQKVITTPVARTPLALR